MADRLREEPVCLFCRLPDSKCNCPDEDVAEYRPASDVDDDADGW